MDASSNTHISPEITCASWVHDNKANLTLGSIGVIAVAVTIIGLLSLLAADNVLSSSFALVNNRWIAFGTMAAGGLALGTVLVIKTRCISNNTEKPEEKAGKEEVKLGEMKWPNGTKEVTYKTVSWNLGSNKDFVDQGKTNLTEDQESKVSEKRYTLFTAAFKKAFDQFDFILLQETDARVFSKAKLEELMPGYAAFTDTKNNRDQDTAVIWKKDKFEPLEEGVIWDDFENYGTAYVRFKDKNTEAVLCVASGHIEGFSLTTKSELMKDAAYTGDQVLLKVGTKLNQEIVGNLAHTVILGMDANVTWEIHPERLKQLSNLGFVYDEKDQAPTFLDVKLNNPVKLDHFAAKAQDGLAVSFNRINTPFSLGFFKTDISNPGDHSPVITEITLSEARTK